MKPYNSFLSCPGRKNGLENAFSRECKKTYLNVKKNSFNERFLYFSKFATTSEKSTPPTANEIRAVATSNPYCTDNMPINDDITHKF
jgi:hypothetical protein